MRGICIMGKFDASAKKSVLKIKPYVPGKPIEEVEREQGITGVVKLASNENPLGPSKLAVRAMSKKLKDVNLYPESGAFYLRRALAKHLKVKEDMLVFGNGSNELLNLIAEAFVEPGEEVMFSELSFVVYPIATDTVGGTAVPVPHREFTHDMDGFISRLTDKTKLVYICNPNNPTGTIITKDAFERFMAAVNPRTIVVLDEAYFEFVKDKNFPDGIKYLPKYQNLIALRTFSKIYGLAGIRIGYGVADPEMIQVIERVRPPFNANILAQSAAEAALKDIKHVARTIKMNNAGKKYLYAELKKLRIECVPTQANFIFIKLDRKGGDVFAALLKKGVIIRPQHGNFARITIGTEKQNIKLIKALKEIL
jgi:histidinol-phosphate aminotransferase